MGHLRVFIYSYDLYSPIIAGEGIGLQKDVGETLDPWDPEGRSSKVKV